MQASAMPRSTLLLLLLAASAVHVRAARFRTATALLDRFSGGVHGLLVKLHAAHSRESPANATQAAAAVVDFFQAHHAAAGAAGNATVSAALRPACVEFLARSVASPGANWSDADVRAALAAACSERGMLVPASGSGPAERHDCPSFAGRVSDARRARLANGTAAGFEDVCAEFGAQPTGGPETLGAPPPGSPEDEDQLGEAEIEAEQDAEAAGGFMWLIQLVFGVVYYFTVVKKYPEVPADCEAIPDAAKQLQAQNEVQAIVTTSPTNAVLSCCCPAARASHTFHSTNTVNYWCGFFFIMCVPFWGLCCSLFVANSCTPMNKKLGGEERGWFMSLVCTYCCAPCVIAQDAESMDLVVGVKTGVCSVAKVEDDAAKVDA